MWWGDADKVPNESSTIKWMFAKLLKYTRESLTNVRWRLSEPPNKCLWLLGPSGVAKSPWIPHIDLTLYRFCIFSFAIPQRFCDFPAICDLESRDSLAICDSACDLRFQNHAILLRSAIPAIPAILLRFWNGFAILFRLRFGITSDPTILRACVLRKTLR